MPAASGLPPVEELVPQRGSSLFLETVLALREGELRCAGRIPRESAFADGRAAECLVGIELLAQAAAVFQALEGRRGEVHPAIGYVVGVREARFQERTLPVGEELEAVVRRLGGAGALATHEVGLYR